jgi:hypothetical protein
MTTFISGSTGIDKIQNNAVDIADLSATGTPGTNFLRGDNTWADALPTQSGNAGKYLTTDASTASWATVDALPTQSGNAGKFLTTDASTASWAEAGKVLQVVFATHSAESYTTSSGWTNVGLSASITPSSTSSKIFVIASFGTETHGGGGVIGAYTIYHDGTTNLGDSGWGLGTQSGEGIGSYRHSRAVGTVSFLHSPGSVASEHYEVRIRKAEGSGGNKAGPGVKVITLMEIAG